MLVYKSILLSNLLGAQAPVKSGEIGRMERTTLKTNKMGAQAPVKSGVIGGEGEKSYKSIRYDQYL